MRILTDHSGFRQMSLSVIIFLCCSAVLFSSCSQLKQSIKEGWNRPHMVFSQSHGGSTDIFRVILDEEEFTPVLIIKNGQEPHWNEKINMIVFNRGGDLYMCDPFGENLTRLTNTPEVDEGHPAFSFDGTQIAYTTRTDGKQEIWLLDVSTQTNRKLTTSSGEMHRNPSWSPAGDAIVFSAWFTDQEWRKRHGLPAEHNMDLMIVDVATGQMRHLTNTPAQEWRPRWSPDGEKILYMAYKRGETQWGIVTNIFTINVDGTEDGPVLALQPKLFAASEMLPVKADYACWAEYGKYIVFAEHFTGVGSRDGSSFYKVYPGTELEIIKLGKTWVSGQPTCIGLGRDDSRALEGK
jgi:hypothetical protein